MPEFLISVKGNSDIHHITKLPGLFLLTLIHAGLQKLRNTVQGRRHT